LRILGIDPGTNATGYGVVERDGSRLRHVAHGTLRPRRALPMAARLASIHAGLADLIARHQPSCVALERIFVAASPRSAIVLGQARGVALAAAGAAGLSVEEVAPQQVKLAVTGTGAADKAQVQAMVRRLLGLRSLPQADAADALAAAICRAHLEGAISRARRAESKPSAVHQLWEASTVRSRRARARAPRFVLRGAR
jgi:crossover junction endodeoxyribonuclease RuvC